MEQAARRGALGAPGPGAAALGHPALAAVAACAMVAAILEVTHRSLPRGPSALLVVVLAALAVITIAVAREHATAAGWVTVGGSALLVAYDQPLPWAVAAAAAITAFFLGRSRGPLLAIALVIAYAVVAGAAPAASRAPSTVAAAAAAAAAAALGVSLRWRERAAQLTATAHDAERTLLEHVTLEERARIARELHDVVAHHISMIAVQAEAARLLIPDLAPDGQRRLVDIGDTARAALTEMRRLLGVLREGSTAVTARRPQPGLQQLDALVDEARAVTGASLRLIVRGPVRPLDPGVELTAYRIVQEALTNARRHAPGAAIDVELDFGPDALGVRVRDNGLGATSRPALAPDLEPARAGGGHGLNGMRERTTMLGGRMTAGPLPQGGFAVAAVLPREPGS